VYSEVKDIEGGANADYIPYLDQVDSDLFGISVTNVDGTTIAVGDSEFEFGIESISKVMTACLVIDKIGDSALMIKIGVLQTGLPFTSVLAVEIQESRTMNPFVNAGAMATNSLAIPEDPSMDRWTYIHNYFNDFAGRELAVIEELFDSEMETNQHNEGIAILLESYGRLYSDPKETVESYTKQCSFAVNTEDLSVMAAVLANGGVHPVTGKRLLKEEYVPRILALMSTTGLYEKSGEWLYWVGLPAKSGVGGGIMAVCPGKMGVAVFSPPLDEAGNSVKAQVAIKMISEKLGLNPYSK